MHSATKGRSLEQWAELFGDKVVVHVTNATEEGNARTEQGIKSQVVVSEYAQVEKRA